MPYDLVGEVGRQAHGDPADSLRSSPSHDAVVVLESIQQVLDDEFKLFHLFVIKFVFTTFVLIFFHLFVGLLLSDDFLLCSVGDDLSGHS